MRMTIKDIARLSGYGIGTVSRVLNNHPDVSEKARKKILSVIEENNFQATAPRRQYLCYHKQHAFYNLMQVSAGQRLCG